MSLRDGPVTVLVKTLINKGLEHFKRYYSVYYGFVLENEDPENVGRLLVHIPEILGPNVKGLYAMPKGMWGGKGYGIHVLPEKGDMVFIEFRFGNSRYPLWSHGNYAKDEKPEEFDTPQKYGFKTPQGHLVLINDDDNTIAITHSAGHQIHLGDEVIRIENKDNTKIILNKDDIVLNDGSNHGLVKISDLITKLNRIEITFNNHIHPIQGSNTVTPTVLITPLTQQSDLENTKVNH